uniref:G-patch domain-containing protein n=1 Tax=Cajanus cajan TaxID=3821 RepID=A0A151RXD2_CAJCA|nr:hypothetical protein KK1_031157 [Cajanus cajan]
MYPSNMIVRAFDGSRKEVVGEITLSIKIGPTIFNIEFQVMDITPTYSCLLGKPWIHQVKAIPSTLHQKVKFVVDDRLIVVQAKENMFISKPLVIPYVDSMEETLEVVFQALEIDHVEKISNNGSLVAQMLIKKGYQPGQELGKNAQGVIELLDF